MNDRKWLCGAIAAVALLATSQTGAASKEIGDDVVCPVSGQPVDPEAKAEYLGKNVYFCCENCPNAFKSQTAKFELKARHQLAQTGQIVQVACPLSGKATNEGTELKVSGVEVAFCCKNCRKAVNKAEGDAQLKMLFAKLKKGFTLQVKCPVSGKPIDPAQSVKHDGQNVYFCCENCPAAFQADPAKFEAKLN